MSDVMALGIDGIETTCGKHICGFYRGRDGLESILLPYLEAGVEAGEKTLCLIDSKSPEEVLDALRADIEIEHALCSHQLEVKHSTESYLVSGEFRKSEWIEELRTVTDESVRVEGFPRMRAVGEMGWVLRNFAGSDDLFRYEAEINEFVGSYKALYFCLYDIDTASGSMVMDAMKTHPQVLIGGCFFENPYYVGPDQLVGRGSSN